MKVAFVFLCALLGLSAAAVVPKQGRIIGGHNAGDGQYPYMVSLRSAANAHFCGGWIHNTRWIVSAAHCTIGRAIANTVSVVGSIRLSEGGITHRTQSIANHPNYNANNLANDISLLWTADPIVRTPLVQPIPLGRANIGSGTFAVVSGWGLTATPGYAAEILQWLTVATVTTTSCRLSHSLANRSRIQDSNICTDNQTGMGTCNGDNGSPLVAGSTVIGLFSWSIPCAQGLPDVYTRVSSHATWVTNVAGNNE